MAGGQINRATLSYVPFFSKPTEIGKMASFDHNHYPFSLFFRWWLIPFQCRLGAIHIPLLYTSDVDPAGIPLRSYEADSRIPRTGCIALYSNGYICHVVSLYASLPMWSYFEAPFWDPCTKKKPGKPYQNGRVRLQWQFLPIVSIHHTFSIFTSGGPIEQVLRCLTSRMIDRVARKEPSARKKKYKHSKQRPGPASPFHPSILRLEIMRSRNWF